MNSPLSTATCLVFAMATIGCVRFDHETDPPPAVRVTDDSVSGDLLTAAERVRVEAPVSGDVAAAGETVTITGPVDGYVMSAGRNVVLQGRIGNDVWAAGETVDVDGPIGDNARVAGRTVHLRSNTVVGHDAMVAGNSVIAEGRIERHLTVGATTARIGAEVGGTVEAHARQVTISPGALIRGDLVVRSPQPPDISPQAQVLGTVRHDTVDERGWFTWPVLWIACFLALLVLGFAAIGLSPVWPARVAATLRARFAASALTGLVVVILIPIVVVILCLTVIGIPLGIVLVSIYAVILLMSGVFVAFRIGNWLLDRWHRPAASPWITMALGALVVSLAVTVPVLGWLLCLVIVVIGAGALALERHALRAQLRSTGQM